MKIPIILPEGQLHRLHIGPFIKMAFREAPLTSTSLAALVPKELGAQFKIIDDERQQGALKREIRSSRHQRHDRDLAFHSFAGAGGGLT